MFYCKYLHIVLDRVLSDIFMPRLINIITCIENELLKDN